MIWIVTFLTVIFLQGEKMETETKKDGDSKEVKMEKRKKTVNKTIDLPVSARVQGQLSYDRLQAAVSIGSVPGSCLLLAGSLFAPCWFFVCSLLAPC